MSRAKATEIEYARRVGSLVRQFSQTCRVSRGPAPITDHDVIDWMISSKSTWSQSTWRQYKAAVIARLEADADDENAPVPNRQVSRECLVRIRAETQQGAIRRSCRTSGAKAKNVTDSALFALLDHLQERAAEWKWAGLTALWIRAGLLTGLRPCEWEGSYWIESPDSTITLQVTNAKQSNGRANGEHRHLQLAPDRLNGDELWAVRSLVMTIRELCRKMPFAKVYHAVRDCLARAVRQTFPTGKGGGANSHRRKICLYSLRHQFAADAKATELNRAEVAALLGHSTDLTAGRHYARKVSGRAGVKISPDATEVASVRAHPKAAHKNELVRPRRRQPV